jgi:hypothetical protein
MPLIQVHTQTEETPAHGGWVAGRLLTSPEAVRSFWAAFKRPADALHHLCPPPDAPGPPPCTECSPYWERVIGEGRYKLQWGWTTPLAQPTQTHPLRGLKVREAYPDDMTVEEMMKDLEARGYLDRGH